MISTRQVQYSLDIAKSAGRRKVAPEVFARLSPAVPTAVYETYWHFASERQRVFFQRIRGEPAPWSEDPILQRFKFTNAYRASDRASQFLIREVIYAGPQSAQELFFRTLLFKLFNRIQTWEMLESALGEISWESYSFEEMDGVLSEAFGRGERLYSAAYIIPSPRQFGNQRKYRNHLRLLEEMMAAEIPERIQECDRMQDAFDLLLSFPSIGSFLAYQFVTDLNYSTLTDFSESEFVAPGPGALDGIRKCFSDLGGLNEVDTIKFIADRQELEFESFGLDFQNLWSRPLQYIDCQNLFCEVGKYARVAHPEVEGLFGRTRIKQSFRQTGSPLRAWYPPKWRINEHIANEVGA